MDHDKVNEEEAELFDVQENLNHNRFTRFLALDKALPQRDFLQLVDIPTKTNAPYEFKYDAEWLAVLRNTNDLMSLTSSHIRLPIKGIDKVKLPIFSIYVVFLRFWSFFYLEANLH